MEIILPNSFNEIFFSQTINLNEDISNNCSEARIFQRKHKKL